MRYSLPDPRCRPHGQSTRRIPEAREQAARPSWVCCRPFWILNVGHMDRGAREPSGSSPPAARSEHPADPRSSGAGSSPLLGVLNPSRILGVSCSIRAPGSPPDPRHRQHGQTSQEDLRSPGAGSSPSWMRCRPSRIFDVGSSVRAPGGSPKPKSRQPGLIDALQDFTDPRRRQLDQSTRQISEARERAARPPGCAAASRILGAGRQVRAPGGSPEPGSGQLAGPGCAAASRILDIGKVAAKPQEAAQALESCPEE